jgi:hypothetical protein
VRRNARALFGRVARELDRLMAAHGKPTTIVSDNGNCIAAASILMDEEPVCIGVPQGDRAVSGTTRGV